MESTEINKVKDMKIGALLAASCIGTWPGNDLGITCFRPLSSFDILQLAVPVSKFDVMALSLSLPRQPISMAVLVEVHRIMTQSIIAMVNHHPPRL